VYDQKPKTAQEFIDANPVMPFTVTARKERNTSFFTVLGYNEQELTQ
jgi:hypothetical protein